MYGGPYVLHLLRSQIRAGRRNDRVEVRSASATIAVIARTSRCLLSFDQIEGCLLKVRYHGAVRHDRRRCLARKVQTCGACALAARVGAHSKTGPCSVPCRRLSMPSFNSRSASLPLQLAYAISWPVLATRMHEHVRSNFCL